MTPFLLIHSLSSIATLTRDRDTDSVETTLHCGTSTQHARQLQPLEIMHMTDGTTHKNKIYALCACDSPHWAADNTPTLE